MFYRVDPRRRAGGSRAEAAARGAAGRSGASRPSSALWLAPRASALRGRGRNTDDADDADDDDDMGTESIESMT